MPDVDADEKHVIAEDCHLHVVLQTWESTIPGAHLRQWKTTLRGKGIGMTFGNYFEERASALIRHQVVLEQLYDGKIQLWSRFTE